MRRWKSTWPASAISRSKDLTPPQDSVPSDAVVSTAEAELESPGIPAPLVPGVEDGGSGGDDGKISGDHKNILGGTAQNLLGLAVFATATAIATLLQTRTLADGAFGIVTQATQFAFIAAAATRFGMDVANVRLVAILAGKGKHGRVRGLVRRSALIAFVISIGFAMVAYLAAGWIGEQLSSQGSMAKTAFQAAAVGIPLCALAFTYMGATRGLKVMRFTLYGQWIGQPVSWIILMLGGWAFAKTAGMTTLAFSLSWSVALAVAWFGWRLLSRKFPEDLTDDGIAEEKTGALLRFGALRAPATLFSQLIFFTDLYVLSALWSTQGAAGDLTTDVYAGTIKVGQSIFLFLISVALTFSPFVADLHHKGEIKKLDGLYKTVTRWALAATIPLLLVLAIMPGQVLRILGPKYVAGAPALRILIIGMIVPVMVGTVGFILIMVGRTGYDLWVYLIALALDLGIAFALAGPGALGIRGAAIAQAVTLTFSAVARLLLVWKFVRIWPFTKQYLRLVPPTVAGGVTMVAVHMVVPETKWLVNLFAASVAGFLIYGMTMVAVGLTPTERAQGKKVLGRLRGRADAPA